MTWLGVRRSVAALAVAWLAWTAVPAEAQTTRNAEARVFFEQGNRHLARAMRARGATRERLLQQALDSYVESLALVRSRNVVFNAALTLQEMGRLEEAFAYYAEYLSMPGLSAEERNEGRSRLDALRERVAVVAVQSEPPGAEVRVDRRDLAPRGRTPLEVAVSPGDHTVFLSLEGYEEAQQTARAAVGQRVEVRAALQPQPVPVVVRAPRGGRLTIDGRPVEPGTEIQLVPGRHTVRFEPAVERVIEIEPGMEPQVIELDVPDAPRGRGALAVFSHVPVRVTIDGAVIGEGRQIETQLAPGRHMVEARAEGHAVARSEIDVEPGERLRLEAEMQPSREGESSLGDWPTLAWAATGVVGATAVAFSLNAYLANQDYENKGNAGEYNDDLYDDVQTANLIADVFWGATAAIGFTAIMLTILDEPVEETPSTLRLGATPLPEGAMLTAELPWRTP